MKRLEMVFAAVLALGIVAACDEDKQCMGAGYRKGGRDPGPVYYLIASDTPANFRRGGVNVKQCDGTADDVQIQAWADQVDTDGFGVIECMPGSYTIGTAVQLPDNCVLRGSDFGVVTWTAANALNNPMVTNKDYDEDDTLNSNIVVRGITFDHDRDNQNSAGGGGRWAISDTYGNSAVVWFKEVNRVKVVDCEVLNASRAGICICQSNDVIVSRCRIDNSNDDSVAIDDACNRAVVSNCTMTDVGKSNDYGAPAGVEVQDGAHEVTVTGNAISCSTTHGSAEPDGISVNAHTSHGTGVYNVAIVGNTIFNGESGIKLTAQSDSAALYSRDVTISGNTIKSDTNIGVAHYGIMLAYGYRVTITGNNFTKDESGFAGEFVRIGSLSDVLIANNVATVLSGGSQGSDTAVHTGANSVLTRVTIKDNVFTDWDYCYMRVEDTAAFTDVVVENNLFTSPNVTTSNVAQWADTSGGTYARCVWAGNQVAEAITSPNYHNRSAGSNFGDSNWKFRSSSTTQQINLVGTWGVDADGAETNGGGISGCDSVTLTEQSASYAKTFDASEGAGTWGNVAVAGARAGYAANYQLFPDSPAATDAVAFAAAVPFCEVAFDTSTQAVYDEAAVLVWQYSTGTSTWSTLTLVNDETGTTGQDGDYFAEQDGAITFIPPSDWLPGTVDSVSGYWIRAVVQTDKGDNMTTVPVTNSKEHELVKPTDAPTVPSPGQITAVRISDRSATLHTATDIKFIVMNFTLGTHSGELTFAQDIATDRWASLAMRCGAGDEIGILCTQEDGTNEVDDCTIELTVE